MPSSSSGDLLEYPIKGRVEERNQRLTRGKKVTLVEDIPPKGPRKNNPHTSPPRTLSQSELDNGSDSEEVENIASEGEVGEGELSFYELSSESASGEKVKATPIDIQNLPPPI